jgi:hypothetical protein
MAITDLEEIINPATEKRKRLVRMCESLLFLNYDKEIGLIHWGEKN